MAWWTRILGSALSSTDLSREALREFQPLGNGFGMTVGLNWLRRREVVLPLYVLGHRRGLIGHVLVLLACGVHGLVDEDLGIGVVVHRLVEGGLEVVPALGERVRHDGGPQLLTTTSGASTS